MKYLITGPNGFIGSSFLRYLNTIGCNREDVILITNNPVSGYRNITHSQYSFSIEEGLYTVFHLAAFIPKSSGDVNSPVAIDNIVTLQNLVQSLHKNLAKFIFFSTVDVYGSQESIITEKTIPSPISLYGLSKLFGERWLASISTELQFPLQILRIGHIYGKGEESYKKLIPTTIRYILGDISPKITSKGTELRTFLHINDCCRMVWSASNLDPLPAFLNIAGEHPRSVLEIVTALIMVSDKKLTPLITGTSGSGHDLVIDPRLRIELIGHETVDLLDGLREEYNHTKELQEV